MTQEIAHAADLPPTTDPSDDPSAGRSKGSARHADAVPGDGEIYRPLPSTTQIVMAVAALVLVTVLSFAAAFVLGDLIPATRPTYWMIEMIFALLCGGAGALIGGSAVVHSVLRLPGNPVHATLGGAAAMVIVGFALARLAEPPEEAPMYTLNIHNLPDRKTIGDAEYLVFAGPANDSNLTFSRTGKSVSLKIPPHAGTHTLRIVVHQRFDKDRSRIFARCELELVTIEGHREGSNTMDLLPHTGGSAPKFNIDFSPNYIERVVAASLQRNEAVVDESCVEGIVATKKDVNTPLGGRLTIRTNSVGQRAWGLARFDPLPRYSVMARDRANSDPQDTQPDLAPGERPVQGQAKVLPPSLEETSDRTSPATMPGVATSRSEPQTVGSAAHPSSARRPPAPPASTSTTASTSTEAAASASLTGQVDAYVNGEDRDRTQLYQSWDQVAGYVVSGLRKAAASGSAQVAPYLNLISNALGTIEDGKYLPPTLRPNWDQSVKPDRLGKNKSIPGFHSDDYRIVVESLCSSDENVRRAAQRLLKLYPSYHFYSTLQALPAQPGLPSCRLGFIVETAAYYFYNRIVEYDGTFTLDDRSRAWIDGNYAAGTDWAKRGEALDGPRPLYTAMFDYARGLVLLDHGEKKDALAAFNLMLDAIRSSGRVYPSNPQHIATALRVTKESSRSTSSVQGASAMNPPDRRVVSRAYVVADGVVSLFATPDAVKPFGTMKSDAVANAYLRAGNWELVEGAGQIGWARRIIASAAR